MKNTEKYILSFKAWVLHEHSGFYMKFEYVYRETKCF